MNGAEQKDEAKTRIFISYSRKDAPFVENLEIALRRSGYDTYLDRKDIFPGEPWQERLEGLISNADGVICVLTDASLGSEHCAWEIVRSLDLGKRVLPLAHGRPSAKIPTALAKLQWTFSDHPGGGGTTPSEPSEEAIRLLMRAINLDIARVREHTRLTSRAAEWIDATGVMKEALLLRRGDAERAKHWLGVGGNSGTLVTSQVLDAYIRASLAKEEEDKRALEDLNNQFRDTKQKLEAELSALKESITAQTIDALKAELAIREADFSRQANAFRDAASKVEQLEADVSEARRTKILGWILAPLSIMAFFLLPLAPILSVFGRMRFVGFSRYFLPGAFDFCAFSVALVFAAGIDWRVPALGVLTEAVSHSAWLTVVQSYLQQHAGSLLAAPLVGLSVVASATFVSWTMGTWSNYSADKRYAPRDAFHRIYSVTLVLLIPMVFEFALGSGMPIQIVWIASGAALLSAIVVWWFGYRAVSRHREMGGRGDKREPYKALDLLLVPRGRGAATASAVTVLLLLLAAQRGEVQTWEAVLAGVCASGFIAQAPTLIFSLSLDAYHRAGALFRAVAGIGLGVWGALLTSPTIVVIGVATSIGAVATLGLLLFRSSRGDRKLGAALFLDSERRR